ncbi:GTP cyclohydrolase, FolE2/MptA family, partial [Pseudomonas syringae group genomosp. 7]|uniref:GTP cyclohydrolase, FolE2/MptA family n=1 Tax=Pseudomonas syringae group genomosp. 7 TaxID=251699 RepID=UPI0037701809
MGALAWVGMLGVEVPVRLAEAGVRYPVHAYVDLQVDLADPSVKGIHMSLLYR